MNSSTGRQSKSAPLQTAEDYGREGAEHMENGRIDAAEACYRRALELDPNYAEAHFKLGNIILKRQLPEEAEACFRRAIDLVPDYVKALYNLGNLLLSQSRLAEAEHYYRRVLAADPDYTFAHANLGVALKEQGRYAEAEACYRAALQLEPDDAETLNNLSIVQMEQGRLAEAETSCSTALKLRPGYAFAHNNLGIIFKEQGRLSEAEVAYRKALDLVPTYAEAHNNLGITLRAQGRLAEAEQAYRKAIEIRPSYAGACNNLGNTLTQLGRHAEAEALYRRILEIEPDNAQTCNNLGGILATLGRPEEAIASFRRALKIDPDLIAAHSNLLFALNYGDSTGNSTLLKEARRFGQAVTKRIESQFSSWSCPAPPKRLRIGLVSADLRHHPVGFFLESLLAHIDKTRIDLVAYPTGHIEDAMTARMRPYFGAWRSIADLNDKAAAHLIHADGVHILVDLSGHTTNNRLPLFGWKPAPVQASWLGYFATTGVEQVDYLLATRAEIPDTYRDQFTETIYYLPETRLCFTAPQSEVQVSDLPASRTGQIVFGCFQNLSKVGDEVLNTWAQILSALPNASLRFQCPQLETPHSREHLSSRLMKHGIGPGRVSMHGATNRESYLAAHADVDMILDTFPYPGGTTTCEALWMGVPTLTLAGNSMLERQGASFLTVAGLAEWIASSKAHYVGKAITFAQDLKKLANLRSSLRQQVLRSPLFDAPRFACKLEDALWEMWQERGLHQPGGKRV
ncbi:MAG: tetratricopeptide repeat protein [Sulfuritalea sp.]|nr:tetratricopeptide repeat protein [Sulfuritalea sp.]